jgi:hypothetical protein
MLSLTRALLFLAEKFHAHWESCIEVSLVACGEVEQASEPLRRSLPANLLKDCCHSLSLKINTQFMLNVPCNQKMCQFPLISLRLPTQSIPVMSGLKFMAEGPWSHLFACVCELEQALTRLSSLSIDSCYNITPFRALSHIMWVMNHAKVANMPPPHCEFRLRPQFSSKSDLNPCCCRLSAPQHLLAIIFAQSPKAHSV